MSDETEVTRLDLALSGAPIAKIMSESLVKRRGRKPAKFWVSFTTLDEPYKARTAQCRHCLATVNYHKKWEQAKGHLMKCEPFLKTMQAFAVFDRPDWFIMELEKRRRMSSKLLPIDLLRGDGVSSDNGGVSSVSSHLEHVKEPKVKSVAKRVTAGELLLLQAMRTNAKIDVELLQHTLSFQSEAPLGGLRELVTTAFERVQRRVRQRLHASPVDEEAALVVAWNGQKQSHLSYWIAKHDMRFFVERRQIADENPVVWLREHAVRVVASLEIPVRQCVVDAPLEFTEQLMETQQTQDTSPKLRFRPSVRRAMITMARALLHQEDADASGPLDGWLAFALTCQDVLTVAGHEIQDSSSLLGDDNVTVMVMVSTAMRSISLAQALGAVTQAERLLDVITFRESLTRKQSLDEISCKRVCDVVINTAFADKLKQYLAVLQPLARALEQLTRPVIRPSDVLVAFAGIQNSYKSDATLTDAHKEFLLRGLEPYEQVFLHDEYLLAHLLDPAYVGELLDDDAMRHAEQALLARAGETDELKQALYVEFTQFQVTSVQQRDHADGFVHRMLKERKKTVREYWLTDGRRWPRLQALAMAIERVPVDAAVLYDTTNHDDARPELWEPERIAYMRMNAPRLRAEDLVAGEPPASNSVSTIGIGAENSSASLVADQDHATPIVLV